MNYRESPVSGTEWTRCYEVKCQNPYNETRLIEFKEETMIGLSDRVISTRTGQSCALTLDDASALNEFDVINPETGDVIGTSTFMQAYVMLHSLYLHAAQARDNVPVLAVPPME